MGRVPIATENRTGEGGDRFPKVELTQKGQKGRFTIIEEPWSEWVHYVKAPKFTEHGKVIMKDKERKDGTKYEDYDLEFLSSPLCLGDQAVLKDKGLDPDNCPGCEAAQKSGGDLAGPVQRFAVNVAYYTLRGNGFDIASPFSASIKMWTFTGRAYDEIEGIQSEIGALKEHDITLECEDAYWKRNKIGFKMEPGWKHAPRGYFKELLTTPGNRATDAQLKDACGREMSRTRMQDEYDRALRLWRKLRNEGGSAPDTGSGNLDGGIESLLDEESGGLAAPSGEAATDAVTGNGTVDEGGDPFSEFAGEATSNPSPAAAEARESASGSATATATQTVTTPTASPSEDPDPTSGTSAGSTASSASSDDFDFDDLMKDI